MRQPTKKQLRDNISKLQNELFLAISQLPDGDLKTRLVKEYPDYYYLSLMDKYNDTSFLDILNEIGKSHCNSGKEFFWFEQGGRVVSTTESGKPVTITISKEGHG